MATEHHIDSFDLPSFFHLHDLDHDGVWSREEIEAVYGVHHVYSQKKSPSEEEHQKKADYIANFVLDTMDKNKDGKVSLEEFEAVGLNGLPSFDGMGAEGHHYDIESEFFLHHEEEFHNTPETQTDESYVHAEDLEHFAQHEAIERQEAVKEAEFQGISVDEAIAQHAPHDETHKDAGAGTGAPQDNAQVPVDPLHDASSTADPHDAVLESPGVPKVPKINRQTPPEKKDPAERFQDAKKESSKHGEWGTGDGGYNRPATPGERMRKNVPYKYKFRRNWGDF